MGRLGRLLADLAAAITAADALPAACKEIRGCR